MSVEQSISMATEQQSKVGTEFNDKSSIIVDDNYVNAHKYRRKHKNLVTRVFMYQRRSHLEPSGDYD